MICVTFGAVLGLVACSSNPVRHQPAPTRAPSRLMTAPAQPQSRGLASWYGRRFNGRRTASGERFNMHALTAAHRSLPFGSRVLVTNPRNGRTVVVKVNDRGPFDGSRLIDLSYQAAKRLGIISAGVAEVKIEVLTQRPPEGKDKTS